MVFFPDQALKFPDPGGGSRALARGLAAGNASRRTELARLQQIAENDLSRERLSLRGSELDVSRARLDVAQGNLSETRRGNERKRGLEDVDILTNVLEGIATAPDNILPQVLASGIETAKRLGVDTSKYQGIAPAQARDQAKVDLQTLVQFRDQKATPATNPVNLQFPDGRIQAFDPRSPELQEALKTPGVVEIGLNVQAGSVADLPGKNRQDEIRSTIGAVSRARSKISRIRQSITENRSRAGLTGTVKRLGQKAAGIALDLVDLGVDVPGVVSDISTDVVDDIENGRTEESVASFFDASLPQNQVFENSLAYALARARKGTGRLNLQDVQNARGDVAVTGLSSVDEVLAKLEAVDSEFSEAQEDLRTRLKGETRDETPTFRVEGGRLIRVE